LILDNPMK